MSGPEPDSVTETRPWEHPGQWRRDGLPHRARLLVVLVGVATVSACSGWVFVVPAPVGVGLGLLVWLLARRDLRLMAAGLMDPAGEEQTRQAQQDGCVSFWVALLPCLALCVLGWCYLLGVRFFVIRE
jgi:hypothetical protein